MDEFAELWQSAADVPFLVGDEVWACDKRYRGVVIGIYNVRWNGGPSHPNLLVEGWKLTGYDDPTNSGVSQIVAPVTSCELIHRPSPDELSGDGPDGRIVPNEPAD